MVGRISVFDLVKRLKGERYADQEAFESYLRESHFLVVEKAVEEGSIFAQMLGF